MKQSVAAAEAEEMCAWWPPAPSVEMEGREAGPAAGWNEGRSTNQKKRNQCMAGQASN